MGVPQVPGTSEARTAHLAQQDFPTTSGPGWDSRPGWMADRRESRAWAPFSPHVSKAFYELLMGACPFLYTQRHTQNCLRQSPALTRCCQAQAKLHIKQGNMKSEEQQSRETTQKGPQGHGTHPLIMLQWPQTAGPSLAAGELAISLSSETSSATHTNTPKLREHTATLSILEKLM